MYLNLFRKFLAFGFQAWGGPVAQLAMLKRQLVERENWVSQQEFNRTLALYQALPGPEAHEMCVYFGMVRAGRLGGLLSGLGFMLPGFVLMLLLSYLYLHYGISTSALKPFFLGLQAGVAALIVCSVYRIAKGALQDLGLAYIALISAIVTVLNLSFLPVLILSALIYVLWSKKFFKLALLLGIALLAWAFLLKNNPENFIATTSTLRPKEIPTLLELFLSGLRAGLLTFGGAYTAIPFVRSDAVLAHAWLTDQQFLDGLALAGIIPAPLIIFTTFVGYVARGFLGACMITLGVFIPAFSFTLIGHNLIEQLVKNKNLHAILEGITAAVVGIIAATSITITKSAVPTWKSALIFSVAFLLLTTLRKPKILPAILGVSALFGGFML